MRDATKMLLNIAKPVAIIWSLFQLYFSVYGTIDTLLFRSTHVIFAITLILLTRPFTKKLHERKGIPLFLDITLVVLSVSAGIYMFLEIGRIAVRETFISPVYPLDLFFGVVIIILVLESVRRSIGLPLTILAVIFLIYAMFGQYMPGILAHRGISFEDLIEYQILVTEGVFGIPTGVSATYVFLFILFAAFLEKTGGSRLFVDLAFALTGRSRGGPAKAAVIASSLMGTISGSAVANVVGTGVFTIPLMKKIGYKPHFAGAIEAVASTGGQIMPPIMGAGAFIMAELTGIPYFNIAASAAIPAILYYAAVFMAVHLIAVKMGLKGIPKSELPSLKGVLLNYGHLFVSLIVIIIFLALHYTPIMAAFMGIVSTIIVSPLRKVSRLNVRSFLEALELGALRATEVAIACAAAGIVVGVITLTGLGLRFSSLVMSVSGGQLLIALLLLMFTAIILGMGMPTTAAYITVAALEVPVLINLGVTPLAAHMFAFYFAILSMITPPVALAAYAGAGLAGSEPMKTGFTATSIGLVAFIIPYAFVYDPSLLLIGSPSRIIIAFITALVGSFFIAVAIVGQAFDRLKIVSRVIFLIAALLLIHPSLTTDVIGMVMGGGMLLYQLFLRGKLSLKGV